MGAKELEALKGTVIDQQHMFFKGVLYGEFGVRKTTTALRTSQKRAILLAADNGWQVVNNHPDEFKDKVTVLDYEGLSQIDTVLEAVALGEEPFHDVDLVVMDTVSQFQENYIDFLMENAQYAGNFREKAVARSGVKGFETTEIPGMADYHLARNKFRPVVTRLVKAPVNVIFLAHVREPGPIERSNGKLERRPNITEALYKIIGRNASFIGYMSRDKSKEYVINFEPKATQSAKSQIPELTDTTIKADKLPEILNKWRNK